jgi:NADH dehydrogenase (ubiquinone) 1 beta subcomplex subunit 9
MNTAFREATAWMKPVVENLTHTQKVQRLYRHSLKCMMSWAIQREIINEEAYKLRARFEQHRNLAPGSPAVNKLCREAEEELFSYTHPDQYVLPWMPGGSMFMRNPPIPMSVVYPHGPGEGDEYHERTVNIDQVPTSVRAPYDNGIVDFSKKNVEWSDALNAQLSTKKNSELERSNGGPWATGPRE